MAGANCVAQALLARGRRVSGSVQARVAELLADGDQVSDQALQVLELGQLGPHGVELSAGNGTRVHASMFGEELIRRKLSDNTPAGPPQFLRIGRGRCSMKY